MPYILHLLLLQSIENILYVLIKSEIIYEWFKKLCVGIQVLMVPYPLSYIWDRNFLALTDTGKWSTCSIRTIRPIEVAILRTPCVEDAIWLPWQELAQKMEG